jgi:hypothetical protein
MWSSGKGEGEKGNPERYFFIQRLRRGDFFSEAAPSESEGARQDESSSLLWVGTPRQRASRKSEVVKATLYAVQVFYSFFIM